MNFHSKRKGKAMFSFFQSKKQSESQDNSIESLIEEDQGLLDLLSPDSIEEHPSYVRLGGNYVRTLAVAHFANEVTANFLSKLHMMNANVSIIHHIEPTSADDMIKA